MIYISTSCIKGKQKISDSIIELIENGFLNIELSGGTEYYPDFKNDLISRKNEFNINYLLHNYFPPPKQHFVLNLASLNDKIFNLTLEHYKRSIELSEILGSKRFGLHAGFLIDPNVKELGKKIGKDKLYDKEKSIERFCLGYEQISSISNKVKIHIENNVFSYNNSLNFAENPFLFTDYDSYLELKNNIDFPVLLDLAHLKVSCKTLGLVFKDELHKSLNLSDYIHISDNSGYADSNNTISEKSDIFELLKAYNLKDKTITLEIYEDLEQIKNSYKLISNLI